MPPWEQGHRPQVDKGSTAIGRGSEAAAGGESRESQPPRPLGFTRVEKGGDRSGRRDFGRGFLWEWREIGEGGTVMCKRLWVPRDGVCVWDISVRVR